MTPEELLKKLINFINGLDLPDQKNFTTYVNELENDEEYLNKFHVTVLSLSNHIQAFYRSITKKDSSPFLLEKEFSELLLQIASLITIDPVTKSVISYPNDEEITLCAINFEKILLNSPLENSNNSEFYMESADDIINILNGILYKTLTHRDCESKILAKLNILDGLLTDLSNKNKLDFAKINEELFIQLKEITDYDMSEEKEEEIKLRFFSFENPFLLDFKGAFGQQMANIVDIFNRCFPEKKRFFDEQVSIPFDEINLINTEAFLVDADFGTDNKLKILNVDNAYSLAIMLQNLIGRLDKIIHQDVIDNIKCELTELALDYRNKMLLLMSGEHRKIKAYDILAELGVEDMQHEQAGAVINESEKAANSYFAALSQKIEYYKALITLSLYAYTIRKNTQINEKSYQSFSLFHLGDRHRDNAFLLSIKSELEKLSSQGSERCLTQPLLPWEEIGDIFSNCSLILEEIEKKLTAKKSLSYMVPKKFSSAKQSIPGELTAVKRQLSKIQMILSYNRPKEAAINNNNNI